MLFRKCTDVLGKYEGLSKNYIFFNVIILLINEPAFIVSYTYASQDTLN